MRTFILWCILFCFSAGPLALIALILYPIVWLLAFAVFGWWELRCGAFLSCWRRSSCCRRAFCEVLRGPPESLTSTLPVASEFVLQARSRTQGFTWPTIARLPGLILSSVSCRRVPIIALIYVAVQVDHIGGGYPAVQGMDRDRRSPAFRGRQMSRRSPGGQRCARSNR